MRIDSVHIKNFRCLKDTNIPFDELTVLVGSNGTGKSCVLQALNLFYNTTLAVDEEDYYDNDTSEEITITLRFNNLTPLEKKEFNAYLEGDELSIENVIQYSPTSKPTQKYHGTRYQNLEFAGFRRASGTSALRKEYASLLEQDKYSDFPAYTNKANAEATLEHWELQNRDQCQRVRDDGQFFGFQNVGTHKMEKYTKFIFIPAVQEASEEGTETKGSIFQEIMGIVVKTALASNQDIIQFKEDVQKKYQQLIDHSQNENLVNLENELTESLNFFVSDSSVKIKWIEDTGVRVDPPKAYVKLNEGGHENTINRCGHGLQRAYILALFQR